MNDSLQESLKNLPTEPGVYIYRDNKKKVLYVGKAINLKNRVSSYFSNYKDLSPKTRALVEKIDNLQTIKVQNELESLLLESELIKRYKPPYNINLKDDKFYKYIKIETRADGNKTITTARQKESEKSVNNSGVSDKKLKLALKSDRNSTFFGPFPESSSITIILKLLRKVFPYKDCNDSKYFRYKKSGRPCLYGFIGACPAPCVSEDGKIKNKENINKIIKYLKGDRKQLFVKLKAEMETASKDMDFEKAAYLRDQIRSYEYLIQDKREVLEYTKNPNLIEDTNKIGLKKLIEVLSANGLNIKTFDLDKFRIETYDISNMQGTSAVGAVVVQTGGMADKKEYRKFRIKSKNTPDDFWMMKEMLKRRFAEKNTWTRPDLVVIDGGKGQLSAAFEVLDEYKLDIPVIGLAKRLEEIVIKIGNDYIVIDLEDNHPGLNILKRGRDEAHRFGRNYYRKLHIKNMLGKDI